MHLVLNVAPGELPTLYLAPLNPPHIIQHPLKSTPPPLLSPSQLKAEAFHLFPISSVQDF